MTEWDLGVLDYIQEHMTSAFGDVFFPAVTHLGDLGLFWIAFDIFLFVYPKTRRMAVAVALALLLETACCNLVLKPLAARVRPFEVNTAVQLLIDAPTDFSFPSGHTAMAFAVTSAVFFSKSRLWIPALAFTTLIAFSRLYLYVHYPTDVLAGVAVGMACGWLAAWVVRKAQKRSRHPDPVEDI